MSVCLNPQGDAFLLGAGCGTKLVISPASPPKRSRAPGWHIGKTRASLSGSGAHQACIAQWIRVLSPAHSDTMSLSRRDQSGSCVGTLLLQFGEDITGRCGWVNGRRQTTVARVQKSSPALRRTAQCVPARWKPFKSRRFTCIWRYQCLRRNWFRWWLITPYILLQPGTQRLSSGSFGDVHESVCATYKLIFTSTGQTPSAA